jgi:3'(2'), 5'-bisphosphate nucleotidase
VVTAAEALGQFRPLLGPVLALARDAGKAILRCYGGSDLHVERKADDSPLTEADRAAHHILVDGLTALDGSIPVISEEGELAPYVCRREWERFWLVDPLDGTKEFIKRNGEFTVNVALIEGGQPVLGVVLAPALDLLYWAVAGSGTWKQERGGDPVRVYSTGRGPDEPLVVVESRSHPSPELEGFLAKLTVAKRVEAGSSLKFCWVAEGKADVYPRFGPTMEWDVAAGDCVYRNSGREGTRSSPLRYNKHDLRNESFVIGL